MSSRDALHDAQLLRDLDIINERTLQELGPLPARGSPVAPGHRSRQPNPYIGGEIE